MSSVNRGWVKLGSLGEVTDGEFEHLRLGGNKTLIDSATLFPATRILGKFFNTVSGGKDRLVDHVGHLILIGGRSANPGILNLESLSKVLL